MLPSTIKSRPVYPAALVLDPKGARHILVAQGAAARPVISEALTGGRPALVLLDAAGGSFEAPPGVSVETYADVSAGIARLTCLLDAARMGVRLYAIGPEQFVWSVAIAADPFGFGKGEVVQVVAGSIARRVFCTHCKTMSEGVTDNVWRCPGCERRLQVRDHFSRRRGAFMGVAADAETPGQPVAVETLFP